MTGWARYPGALAHYLDRIARPLERVVDGERVGIGVAWYTACNRELLFFHAEDVTSRSADWVDGAELRAEAIGTRPFCLRCAYWTALDALVLDHHSLSRFVEEIESGGIPGMTWPRGLL